MGNGEYAVRVLGLVSFLPHCNANYLVLEMLKRDKTWGTICISVPHSKFWEGTRTPVLPQIYAHACAHIHIH